MMGLPTPGLETDFEPQRHRGHRERKENTGSASAPLCPLCLCGEPPCFCASIEVVKDPDIVRMRIVVSGMVQGVGFRYSTVDQGRRLGLDGWARNTRDGCVEIVAEGPAEKVERLARWCESGPPSARVISVDRELLPVGGERLEGFGVRY